MNTQIDFNDIPKIIYTVPTTNAHATTNASAIRLHYVCPKPSLIIR